MSVRPIVVIAEELEPQPLAWLAERADVREVSFKDPGFTGALAEAEGLVIRSYTRVNDALLAAAPRLRAIARPGVGLDNVDIPACQARGVRLFTTPGANAQAVVELVLAFALDALRPRVFLERPLDLDNWKTVRNELTGQREIGGMTVGVLGAGHVGSRACKAFAGLGSRVIYHDIDASIEIPTAARTDRDTLLAEADLITVHIDERPENHHHLNADAFGRLRSDVVFINTARGLVVDPHACADFFINHPAATAMLDVHDPEPFDATYPLLDITNVHLTPHIGGATTAAKLAMSWVVRDLSTYLSQDD